MSSWPGSKGNAENDAKKFSRRYIRAPARDSKANTADTTAGINSAFSCTWKPTRKELREQ